MLGSSVFAEDGFKLSGYIRAGLSTDVTGDDKTATTSTWFDGDYFGGPSRIRINMDWTSADGTSGASFRLQTSSASEAWSVDSIAYAFGYTSLFNNMVTIAAGKLHDNWAGYSYGWNGWSAIDGKSGAAVILSPVEGLNLVAAGVIDYETSLTETVDGETTDTYTYDTKKDLAVFEAQYSYGPLVINGGYALSETGYATVQYSTDTLTASADYYYDWAKDGMDNTISEWVEYTGVDKMTLGAVVYEYMDDDAAKMQLDITPAVKYQITDLAAASLEGTYHLDLDESDNNTIAVTPAVVLTANDTIEAEIWGTYGYDNGSDDSTFKVGAGVKKSF